MLHLHSVSGGRHCFGLENETIQATWCAKNVFAFLQPPLFHGDIFEASISRHATRVPETLQILWIHNAILVFADDVVDCRIIA